MMALWSLLTDDATTLTLIGLLPKGRHVVIHDVIHDDNEVGNIPISYQDVVLHEYCNFHVGL